MAEFIKLYKDNTNPKDVQRVIDVLKRGGIIIYPTDTVYGLGCDITNIRALERNLSNLSDYVKQIDTSVFKILKRALPGPYTFILPGAKSLPNPVKKRKTVGIRVPDNTITLEIVKALGNPLVSTSIRDEDEIIEYTTDPELILEKWGTLVDVVIDGGYGDNEASTIVDLSVDPPEIIREGKGSLEIF